MKKNNSEISEFISFIKEIGKDMPAEYKRTLAIGGSSTVAFILSVLLKGTAKKVAIGAGLALWVASMLSGVDATNKLIDELSSKTKEINSNWEAYKAAHPDIFGTNN